MGLFEFRDDVFVFVEEDCFSVDVEGLPEEGFVRQAEDEEVARRGSAEDGGDGLKLGGGHVGVCGVGCGGVMEEGVCDGGGEGGVCGGGRGDRCGVGDRGGEGEDEGESEEGDEE